MINPKSAKKTKKHPISLVEADLAFTKATHSRDPKSISRLDFRQFIKALQRIALRWKPNLPVKDTFDELL